MGTMIWIHAFDDSPSIENHLENRVAAMYAYIFHLISGLFFVVASPHAMAQAIDPEKYIQTNGYHSNKIAEDGKTRFYSFTERASASRIADLESEIKKLAKHVEVQKLCEFMRDGAKVRLSQQQGVAIDVALVNYGHNGSTIACVLKYSHKNDVGTQIVYSKKGTAGMYLVFVAD